MITIAELRAAGILSPLQVHFARALERIGGERRPEVLLAAALLSRHVSNGHVCLDLPRLIDVPRLVGDGTEPLERPEWPRLDAWIDALHTSTLVTVVAADAVSSNGVRTPLVLDDAGRLYLQRYWEHQRRVAGAIAARVQQLDAPDPAVLRDILDRLFPATAVSAHGVVDWQRMAAVIAAHRRFCVISGGPGTGKTFTVVKILALLIELAQRSGARVPAIILLAPTGKAAARLAESIRHAKRTVSCAPAVCAAIPDGAATIHRCLGASDGSATRVRHHAGNPLLTDTVLVDEASMVDLALMARLLDAVPPAARVILLGDKDQLASVEAGAVLGDICNTGRAATYSPAFAARIRQVTGEPLPVAPDARRDSDIGDCIVHLTHSYRYAANSSIAQLAAAINDGDAGAALAILRSSSEVRLIEPKSPASFRAELREQVTHGFRPYLRDTAASPRQRLRMFEGFRVLCAHRRGPTGVETVNVEIEAMLREAGLLEEHGMTYAGRPIVITRNDYQLNLFNGDVGLIVAHPERPSARVAAFAATDPQAAVEERVRLLSASRLPPHETVFAMSIHKSQGSEFDAIAVLLPDEVSPVLSRELLYTAVTRARRRVSIFAPPAVLTEAVTRRIERASGLRDMLWGVQSPKAKAQG